MIRRIEAWSPQMQQVCDVDVFGTRTAALFSVYGAEHPDVSFYAQVADDRCLGVLSSAFGNSSLTVAPQADLAEWREFMLFFGLETLLCARDSAHDMGLSESENGFVMRYTGAERSPVLEPVTAFHAAFSYREVYDLLCACGFSLGAYEPWLGDLALRVRHGASNVICLREGTTVATASVLFESEFARYLGAVATHPSARGQGFAGDLVLRLAQCGKRAEILCKAHRVSFYTSLGFGQIGEYSLCRFSG